MMSRRDIPIAASTVCLLVLLGCDSRDPHADEHDHSGEQVEAVVDEHGHESDEVHEGTGEPDDHQSHGEQVKAAVDEHDHEGHEDHESDEVHEGTGEPDDHQSPGEQVKDAVDEHDHEGHEDHESDEVHEGTGEPDDHQSPGERTGDVVVLTAQQRERIGLRMQPAAPAVLSLESNFPGEVILVPDRVAHIVPQAPGIVRESFKTIGDRVEIGETLACIESSELAEAKLAFFSAAAEIGHFQIALPRAREIQENVNALLRVLDADADPESIKELDGREMGEWRGRLISAQADLDAARAALERERSLRERKVTSETALINATASYARSRAHLDAEKDTARYSTLMSFSEVARKRQVAELSLMTAENRLRVLGVEDAWIDRLSGLVPKLASFEPCVCSDPECTKGEISSITEALDDEPDLGRYCLRAQQEGIIIEKHLSLGERISGEESVFMTVDTGRVWVRFNVYQKDLDLVREGTSVIVMVRGVSSPHEGTISYVSPVVDERTRTVAARVELDNPDGSLRPGLFVSVSVADPAGSVAVAVPRDAVQTIDQREVVLVEEGGGFVPVSVRTGRSDGVHVQILDGLEVGTLVVVEGAFDIKAKIVTTGLGSHAGHGH